jgi:hypothetical protein
VVNGSGSNPQWFKVRVGAETLPHVNFDLDRRVSASPTLIFGYCGLADTLTSSFLFCLLWTCSVDHIQSRQNRKEEVRNELLFFSLLPALDLFSCSCPEQAEEKRTIIYL